VRLGQARLATIVVLLLGGIAAAAAAFASSPHAAATSKCKRGTAAAKISGKRVCLASGQRCKKSLDKQYHRYKFHCRTGRLTRVKPKPAPEPPAPQLPGKYVDVGGYKLYIHCIGSGSPTVVFEGGSGTAEETRPAPGSAAIHAAVADGTRVCAYDRAGLGASDKRPAGTPSKGKQFADELHALLAGANIAPPYVLVGPSYGGYIAMSYTLYYPAESGGLVFVDSVAPCTCSETEVEPASFDLASVSFGARPVVVLRATLTDGRDLASRSTNSILVNADSTHFVVQERPELTIASIRLVVDAVRSSATLPPCAQTMLPSFGGKCE